MRYPALTLLMAFHYLAALLGGYVAFGLVRQRLDSFWAVVGAVGATVLLAAIGDALRLAMNLEDRISALRPTSLARPQAPVAEVDSAGRALAAYDRLDAAVNGMFDRLSGKPKK